MSKKQMMNKRLLFIGVGTALAVIDQGRTFLPPKPNSTFIDASASPAAPVPIPGLPPVRGGPLGQLLSIDSASLSLDGVRILPFAGEMHFSRVPRSAWAADLAALKAGGLDVVQAYVFWLHVEEVRGVQDWSGNRNLSAFLAAAGENPPAECA
jgi:hypothetical protein